MRKILLVNNGYPSPILPNYTTYIASMKECLEKAGLWVDVLAIKYTRKKNLWYMAYSYAKFWLRCISINLCKYDYIYINHAPFVWPLFFNMTLNCSKVFVHWHGDEVVKQNCFLKISRAIISIKILKCRHIVPSCYFQTVISELLGVKMEDITVSPSGGVDVELFRKNTKTENFDKSFVLGFSSGMSKGKGADLIMKLIEKVNSIEEKTGKRIIFNIVDYGEDMAEYYDLLSKNVSVILTPKMPKNKMPEFYSKINLLLMSSRRKSESLGLVVLEAMSCEKPVVSFNMFAFPEFVISGISGEMVQYSDNVSKNADNFISAICKVHDNYSSYKPRSIILKRYSESHVIEQYKKLFGR